MFKHTLYQPAGAYRAASTAGDAPAVAQLQTITIGTNDVATTYKVTINGKTVSVPGNAGGANSTAADLAAALQVATVPQEFAEIVWSQKPPSGR